MLQTIRQSGLRVATAVAVIGLVVAMADAASSVATPRPAAVPRYDHVFVVVEENHGFSDVIGNPAAPNLNALDHEYGLGTSYYGVAHPSEPNYVAMLGGSTFGVANDNPYYLNRVDRPSLISQLDNARVSWRAYLQGVPHAGYQGICYPANCNGTPDKDPLYVSKHNGIVNFSSSWNAHDRARQVPVEQLASDLRRGDVPDFGFVAPDECHDMHGDPPYCIDSAALRGAQDQRLVATGDRYLGGLVSAITSAPFWARGNNAVVLTFDEGGDNSGCCGTAPGGGRVATVVVTSHGPRGVQDATPYNHYSLLTTLQRTFGLGCLQNSCDTAHVTPMSGLFTVTGSAAHAYRPSSVPHYAISSNTPNEPVSYPPTGAASAGWSVVPAPKLGSADNSFGAVCAVSARDVWAVGNYLPDATGTNPDSTLTLAAHFDGSRWKSAPTPNAGPAFNTLFGVAARPGHAWAVGVRLDDHYTAHSLIETWNGRHWSITATPRLATQRDLLLSASAVNSSDVWAVGEQQDHGGRFTPLIEHFNGRRWSVVPAPAGGSTGGHLYGVAAAGPKDVWAVGQRNSASNDQALVEHWNGRRWSVIEAPKPPGSAVVLDAVTVHDGHVWAVGQTDDAIHGGRPVVEHYHAGRWDGRILANVGSKFSNLTGVAVAGPTVWTVGTYFDAAAGKQQTLIARRDESSWKQVAAPSPGAGDNVLGGIAAAGTSLWAVGYDKNAGSRQPLIEHHPTS